MMLSEREEYLLKIKGFGKPGNKRDARLIAFLLCWLEAAKPRIISNDAIKVLVVPQQILSFAKKNSRFVAKDFNCFGKDDRGLVFSVCSSNGLSGTDINILADVSNKISIKKHGWKFWKRKITQANYYSDKNQSTSGEYNYWIPESLIENRFWNPKDLLVNFKDWMLGVFRYSTGIKIKDQLLLQVKKAHQLGLIEGYNNFYRLLDQDILAAVEQFDFDQPNLTEPNHTIFYWYNQIASLNAQQRLYRIQAIQAFPFLLRVTVEHSQEPWLAIDRGEPLIELIAKYLGMPRVAVKSLNGLSTREMANANPGVLVAWHSCLIRTGKTIDDRHWPRNQLEWRRFALVFQLIDNYAYYICPNLKTMLVYRDKPAWREDRKDLLTKSINNDFRDFIDSFTSCILYPIVLEAFERISLKKNKGLNSNVYHDWNLNLSHIIVKPILFEGVETSVLEHALLKNWSFIGLLELSQYYHDNASSIVSRVKLMNEVWPKLMDDRIEDIFGFTALASAQELLEEGKQMSHCVGSYASKCVYDNTTIISVTNKGKRSSTLELVFSGEKFQIVQHKGFRNSIPGEQERIAAQNLVKKINRGEITINSREKKHYNQTYLAKSIGYDCSRPENLQRAMDAWKFCIPLPLQNLSYPEWVEKLRLNEMIEQSIKELSKSRI